MTVQQAITPQHFAPLRRIKPMEGMLVTETIWEEAHEFHRQQQRLHGLYAHGAGILAGLDVIASDPPDREVYVLPGMALDSVGNLIVVPRPVAFSLGSAQGELRLVLSYGESEPRNEKLTVDDNALRIQSEFLMETQLTQDQQPNEGCVELARLRCTSSEQPITNAANPAQPGAQEIDLRFRCWIGSTMTPSVRVGVLAFGNGGAASVAGVQALAGSIRAQHHWRVWVDEDIVLGNTLQQYQMLAVIGAGGFELDDNAVQRLRTWIDQGGTLFAEIAATADRSAAEHSFRRLFQVLGLTPQPISGGATLLRTPNVFGRPPNGASGNNTVAGCPGLIYSGVDYARLWQGEYSNGPARREDIRAAHEFGQNILYAVHTRASAKG